MEHDVTVTDHRAPTLATWLLHWVLPPKDRDAMLGDLIEEYRIRSAESPTTATRWYWAQVCRSIPIIVVSVVRHRGWPLTVSIGLGVYVLVGAINVVGTAVVAQLVGVTASSSRVSGVVVGLSAIAIGGYVAGWMRRGAATVVGGLVLLVAVLLIAAANDTAPFWYQLTFLTLGPLAARTGGALSQR
jgi:hypothetical protein